MKLMMLTACLGEQWQELRSIVEPNLREYAQRYGFGFDILDRQYCDSSWFFPFQKTQWVRDVMQENDYDYFWVLDCDLLITNFTKDVRDFIDNEHSIFITRDLSDHLNVGSYILKKSPIAKVWLDSIVRLRTETTSEQHAALELFKADAFMEATKVLPHPSINSYRYDLYESFGERSPEEGQHRTGGFLVHLPGMSAARRVEILTYMLPEVIR